jgi:serine-aspartate repeat-containing protein C/D/E
LPAPTLLSPANGESVAGTTVRFEWSAVSGAVDYLLLASTGSNPFDASKRKLSLRVGNVTNYVDTGYLGNGTKYYWWVSAYYADGAHSEWSEVIANGRSFFSVAVTDRAAVGDFVWEDLNKNGVQDQGEPGLYNVTVQLFTCSGSLIGSITTDNYGYYFFSNLAPGSYYLHFVAPSGYVFSPTGQAGDATNSDANAAGNTECFSLASGQNDAMRDAGLHLVESAGGSVGDFVWEDFAVNGIQDTSEIGVPNVSVELYNCDGSLVGSTTTDASGHYAFSNLAPGSYYLHFVAPTGFAFTHRGVGSDVGKDSDANEDGVTACFTVVSGQSDLSRDAGAYNRASFDPLVWEDINGNGVQDQGEVGLHNVTVELYTSNGLLAGSTTTDAYGYYAFSNLTPGSYYLKFLAPTGHFFSPKGRGSDPARDSDANADGTTDAFSLAPGGNDMVRDAGLYRRASIGDFVWEDVNEDGIQDQDEVGMSDVTIELRGDDGWLVASTVTDASGHYKFSDLTPGNYRLRFVAPEGYRYCPGGRGGDGATDSNACAPTGDTECFALASGEAGSAWDAGLYREDEAPRRSVSSFVMWAVLAGLGVVLTGSGLLALKTRVLGAKR